MRKINTFILLCQTFLLMMLFSGNVWSKNKPTTEIKTNNYNCTLTTTATPNGVFCGETTGFIEVAINGGIPPYKIEWDNADNSIWAEALTNDKNFTIEDLPPGWFKVKIMDADGCRETHSVKIDVNASNLTYTIEPSEPCSPNGSFIIRIAGSSPPYWIILDGPTSHLDLESITALNDGLIDFKETILFSSHDHEFIQTIANRIIEIDTKIVEDKYISYNDYLALKIGS